MPEPLLTKRFLLVTATNFCLFLVTAAWSFLPLFIVERGGDSMDVGIVMGSLGITSLGSLPFLAPLIDRHGRRFFMLAGMLLVGLTNGAYLLFPVYSPLMIGVRLMQGLAFAACFNACATAVVELVPVNRRAQGIGLYGISGSLAIAFGPYVAEAVIHTWGFNSYFLLLMGYGSLGFLAALQVREPPRKTTSSAMDGFFSTALKDGHLTVMLIAMMFGAGFSAMTNFLPLYAQTLGLRAGVFFVSYGVSLILVRVLLGQVADNVNREKLILACLVGFGVMLLSTSQINSIVQTAFLGVLFGLAQGMSYPAMMACMVDRSTDANRCVVVALFTGSFGVGINVSVPLWGLIAKFQGLSFMFLAGGLVMLLGAVMFSLGSFVPRGNLQRAASRH